MLQTLNVTLTGTRDLLMANGRLVDPLDEFTQAIAKLDAIPKARKTEKTMADADRLRWLGSVYSNEDGIVVMPGENYEACLVRSGRLFKLGTKVEAGLTVVEESSTLTVKGLKHGTKVTDIASDPKYTHRKRTKRGVMAIRPCFKQWSCSFTIEYDDDIISPEEVETVVQTAGRVGLGSWNKRFGKFETKIT